MPAASSARHQAMPDEIAVLIHGHRLVEKVSSLVIERPVVFQFSGNLAASNVRRTLYLTTLSFGRPVISRARNHVINPTRI
jgi:hypothetical protein